MVWSVVSARVIFFVCTPCARLFLPATDVINGKGNRINAEKLVEAEAHAERKRKRTSRTPLSYKSSGFSEYNTNPSAVVLIVLKRIANFWNPHLHSSRLWVWLEISNGGVEMVRVGGFETDVMLKAYGWCFYSYNYLHIIFGTRLLQARNPSLGGERVSTANKGLIVFRVESDNGDKKSQDLFAMWNSFSRGFSLLELRSGKGLEFFSLNELIYPHHLKHKK